MGEFCFVLLCFKVSLTLEEKQKLAKEQEQAQKLKSQQPLKPQVHTPIAPSKQVRFFCVVSSVLGGTEQSGKQLVFGQRL